MGWIRYQYSYLETDVCGYSYKSSWTKWFPFQGQIPIMGMGQQYSPYEIIYTNPYCDCENNCLNCGKPNKKS